MIVRWTEFAWTMLSQTSDYVLMEFGFKTYDGFMQDVENAVLSIGNNPEIGVIEMQLHGRVQTYRSMTVNKRNKLVYEVREDEGVIYIVDFWETRRDPKLLSISH